MYTKALVASVIVALLISLLAVAINITALFPEYLAFFTVGLLAGIITCVWVSDSGSTVATPRKAAKKPEKSGIKKEVGSVKWFSPSKGFGFITRENGEDVFVHFRSIMGKGHRVLREGDRVEFAVTEGNKGLQAEDVNTVS